MHTLFNDQLRATGTAITLNIYHFSCSYFETHNVTGSPLLFTLPPEAKVTSEILAPLLAKKTQPRH